MVKTLPKINARYWLSLIAASILGTNTGDFVSGYLHLGHLVGLPFLAGLLVIIFLAEKMSPFASSLFFWAAIITVRTAATNIGDAFRDFGIDFNLSLPIVFAIFFTSVLVYRGLYKSNNNPGGSVRVSPIYWICMMLAGVLGTIGGDYASFGLGLMPIGAALVFGIIVGAMLYWGRNGRLVQPEYYWTMLALIRTGGTAAGDSLAHDVFGLPLSTAVTGFIFWGIVIYFYGLEKG